MKTIDFDGLVSKTMTPKMIEKAHARAEEMRIEMFLHQLREETGITQKKLAKRLGIEPPSLCKMEKARDMRVSTLERIVSALDGELELSAKFKSGKKVVLMGLTTHSERKVRSKKEAVGRGNLQKA